MTNLISATLLKNTFNTHIIISADPARLLSPGGAKAFTVSPALVSGVSALFSAGIAQAPGPEKAGRAGGCVSLSAAGLDPGLPNTVSERPYNSF